jgi:conjugative transfer region protein (TIGR03750 family)
VAALLALGTCWVASGYVQAVKRGKPMDYHVLRFELFLHDLKLKRSPYIRYAGVWDIRRRRPLRGTPRLRGATPRFDPTSAE